MQLRQMEIVTDQDKLKVDIQETCMKYKTIKQWAYILHDKDDTRPHFHIYLNFGGSSADTKMVATWFEVPENFIEKVKGRKADMLLYLTHGNETQKNKHQYSPKEVVANFDFETEIAESKIIGDFKNFTYAQMLQYANSLPIVEKTKTLNQLKKLWELECLCSSMTMDRELKVMFITGSAGTGKTYYAKKLLGSLGYDYCMSSSSNDPLQDYLGQKALILDDLRDTAFKFEDFLKITDNNTQSSISSRFHNKIFIGEMIVITSSVPIRYWYKELRCNSNDDSLEQLYRRISCYVEVTKEEVIVYDNGLDEIGKPIGTGTIYKNELLELKKIKKSRFDFQSAFDKICTHGTTLFEESKERIEQLKI